MNILESFFHLGNFSSGIRSDLKNRIPYYFSEFTDLHSIVNIKVFGAILIVFLTALGKGLAFAAILNIGTDSNLGVIEVFAQNAICGMIYSLFSGQPLVIVGLTGPMTVLCVAIKFLTDILKLNYMPFFAWTQIWAGIMMLIFTLANYCSSIRYFTRFTAEIAGILIGFVFLYFGIRSCISAFFSSTSGLVQLWLTCGFVWSALELFSAKKVKWSVC